MKIYKNILSIVVILLLLSSCNDWLDVVQEGTVPTEEIDYTNISQMYGPVSGVYANARQNMSRWEMWPLLNVRGDDVTKGGNSEADQAGFLDVENFNYDAVKDFWALEESWKGLYQIVFTTYNNEVLLNRYRENITQESDLQLALQYEAEIKFHRALAYFFISNLWGDIPLIDPEDVNYGYPFRFSLDSVRKLIHSELDFCITNLPAEQTEHRGAATKWSAMALKAKLALYQGDYATTESLTSEIIRDAGIQLTTEYYQLFKIPGKLAPESLYEFQFTDFESGDGQQVYGGAWFQHQGPQNNPAPISGWGFMLLKSEYINFLNDRGESTRWDVAVLESGTTSPAGDEISLFEPSYLDIKAHYNGKAYTPSSQMTPGRVDYGSNNNIRLLRYADVLLMNAEARVRTSGDAATPLNEVRARAMLDPIAAPTLEDILNERKAEFSVEWGNRFHDLVRTDQAATELPGFVKGEHEFLPIPVAQEDLNPNLTEPVVE
ncbi:RagB/SusD family nutrient uptake outer membrane protein [Saccharicrinis aurantiacus]|uniref:RagB/SusD family nutrient uptake outer membrane protein n=1 Tax=Saccharicrinis aurantiacus TaxID=1849719 RepID=UPI00094F9FD2|nr:RagB/SusD family nutrient uptake outer membrane protein [Saccharicrinis aurantiacus]